MVLQTPFRMRHIEQSMKEFFKSLPVKDRIHYAAIEAQKRWHDVPSGHSPGLAVDVSDDVVVHIFPSISFR